MQCDSFLKTESKLQYNMCPEKFSFRNTRHNRMELIHFSAALFVKNIQRVLNPFSIHHVQYGSFAMFIMARARTHDVRCDMPLSLVVSDTFSLAFPPT